MATSLSVVIEISDTAIVVPAEHARDLPNTIAWSFGSVGA